MMQVSDGAHLHGSMVRKQRRRSSAPLFPVTCLYVLAHRMGLPTFKVSVMVGTGSQNTWSSVGDTFWVGLGVLALARGSVSPGQNRTA